MNLKGLIIFVVFYILHSNIPAYSEVSKIHFGSKSTPLEDLTITWHNNNSNKDSIRWGYTSAYSMGSHAGMYRYYSSRYIFDFTFPELIPDTDIHYSIYDSYLGVWTADKTFHTSSHNESSFTFNDKVV